MSKSAFSDTLTDFFGVLLFKIPCSVLEISPFYIWGREPLLSILKPCCSFSSPCIMGKDGAEYVGLWAVGCGPRFHVHPGIL